MLLTAMDSKLILEHQVKKEREFCYLFTVGFSASKFIRHERFHSIDFTWPLCWGSSLSNVSYIQRVIPIECIPVNQGFDI